MNMFGLHNLAGATSEPYNQDLALNKEQCIIIYLLNLETLVKQAVSIKSQTLYIIVSS